MTHLDSETRFRLVRTVVDDRSEAADKIDGSGDFINRQLDFEETLALVQRREAKWLQSLLPKAESFFAQHVAYIVSDAVAETQRPRSDKWTPEQRAHLLDLARDAVRLLFEVSK